MKILVVCEKPSVTHAIAAAIAAYHPNAEVAFIHTLSFGAARFKFPRGLKQSDFPRIEEPVYHHNLDHDWKGSAFAGGRFTHAHRTLQEWLSWADQIEYACDPDHRGITGFLTSLQPYCDHSLLQCRAYRFHSYDPAGIQSAIAGAAPLDKAYSAEIAAGTNKHFFDYNWLLNAQVVLRPAIAAAGLPASYMLSKLSLQVLYYLRQTAPKTDSTLLGAMAKWEGTGKYSPPGALGSASSRGEIVAGLLNAGLIDGDNRLPFELTETGHRLLHNLHPDCRDLDLPFRLDAWMQTPLGESRLSMERYIKTFFGKQMRFRPSAAASAPQSATAEAFHLWQRITGVDPSNRRTFGDWDVGRTFDALQEAIDLDPTEVTANLLLQFFVNCYLDDCEVTLRSLLEAPARTERMLERVRKVLALINRPEIAEARDAFIASLGKALEHYGAHERDDIQALLKKADHIAILRRDALRSLENLRVNQFLVGEPEKAGTQPVYLKTVHQWWNVNSLLAAVTNFPSGISLHLIRHPDTYQSFFAFVIRNGGNLFVLSDIENYSHPLQGYMSRKPDRALSNRSARAHFPYDLLGVAYDEESGQLYFEKSKVRALATYQTETIPLKAIAELAPEEVLWLTMMFDLIVDRFWKKGYQANALSYTGEMIKADHVLVHAAQKANLPVPIYDPIALAPLSIDDVRDENTSEEAVGDKYHRPNAWMESRYGQRVTAEALNLVAPPETVFMLEHKTGALAPVSRNEIERRNHFGDRKGHSRLAMQVLNSTSFGTREEIERDRLFIARYNFADTINALAAEEYEQRKAEVLGWFTDRLTARKNQLLAWAGNKEVWVSSGQHNGFSHYNGPGGPQRSVRVGESQFHGTEEKRHAFIYRHPATDDDIRLQLYGSIVLSHWDKNFRQYACAARGAKSSYYVVFYPATPDELALLAGCATSELPDVLQHWYRFEPYTGNSILDRVDPMIWRADNPWLKLDLRVLIPLSKRGLVDCERRVEMPDVPNRVVVPA